MHAENIELRVKGQDPRTQEERLSPQAAETIIAACADFTITDFEESFLDELIDTVCLAHRSQKSDYTRVTKRGDKP